MYEKGSSFSNWYLIQAFCGLENGFEDSYGHRNQCSGLSPFLFCECPFPVWQHIKSSHQGQIYRTCIDYRLRMFICSLRREAIPEVFMAAAASCFAHKYQLHYKEEDYNQSAGVPTRIKQICAFRGSVWSSSDA